MTCILGSYQYDMIMAKDVFLHLTFDYIKCSINNFKRTNSTWLLASNYNLSETLLVPATFESSIAGIGNITTSSQLWSN